MDVGITKRLEIGWMKDRKPVLRDGEVVAFYTRRGVLVTRLMKRMAGGKLHVASNFTMRVRRNNRQVYFTLPSVRKDAEKQANKIDAFLDVRENTLDQAVQKFDPEKWNRLNPTALAATVGDVLAAHETAQKSLGLDERTARDYRSNLILIFRQALEHRRGSVPTDEQIKKIGLDEFTVRLAADFKVARVARAGTDKTEIETKKRSVNAVARNARAIFGVDARQHYEHLVLPKHLDDALNALVFKKTGGKKYRLPPVELIRKIFDLGQVLRNGDPENGVLPDRNAYLAYLLALQAGHRKKEIGEAVLDWIEDGEKPRIWVRTTPTFIAKNREEGWAEVQQWVIDEIRALCESPSYILSGTKTERKAEAFDRLNKRLRAIGLKALRPTHELRKLFGSYVANRFDLYRAQNALRHESPDITSDTYADLIVDESILVLWETRPPWAVQPVAAKPAESKIAP